MVDFFYVFFGWGGGSIISIFLVKEGMEKISYSVILVEIRRVVMLDVDVVTVVFIKKFRFVIRKKLFKVL